MNPNINNLYYINDNKNNFLCLLFLYRTMCIK